jgi:protoporphyrinogen oxidase
MANTDLLILGAGLTGLSCAAHHRGTARLLEGSASIGGKAHTRSRQGARFDITGHWLHLRDPEIEAWIASLPGLSLSRHDRKARIFSSGVFTLYPFQANTFGLPPAVAQACLQGFVDARLHDLESGPAPQNRPAPDTFADWIISKFGTGIAEYFMFPYNEKVWTVHPRELSAAWCESSYIPIPKVEDVIAGAVGASREALGYNTHFQYPDDGGGIQGLADAIARTLSVQPELKRPIERIDLAHRRVTTGDGEVIGYERLVSTMPLSRLIDCCARGADLPPAVAAARAELRSTTVSHLDVLARGANHAQEGPWDGAGQPHWTYFPERHFPFYRVGSFSAVEPKMTDGDKRNFYVEIAHRGQRDVHAEVSTCLEGLATAGLIDGVDSVLDVWVEHVPDAYVLQDPNYKASRATLLEFLGAHNVLSTGRYGNWEYSAMEDALLHGRAAAAWAANGGSP